MDTTTMDFAAIENCVDDERTWTMGAKLPIEIYEVLRLPDLPTGLAAVFDSAAWRDFALTGVAPFQPLSS